MSTTTANPAPRVEPHIYNAQVMLFMEQWLEHLLQFGAVTGWGQGCLALNEELLEEAFQKDALDVLRVFEVLPLPGNETQQSAFAFFGYPFKTCGQVVVPLNAIVQFDNEEGAQLRAACGIQKEFMSIFEDLSVPELVAHNEDMLHEQYQEDLKLSSARINHLREDAMMAPLEFGEGMSVGMALGVKSFAMEPLPA